MSVTLVGSDGLRFETGFVPAAACCSSCCHCWTCCCCCCSATGSTGASCSLLDEGELTGGFVGVS